MISCRAARARMLDVARRGASDAVSLEVESHIERCAACEDERARWRLLTVLKDEATPVLGDAAERRILSRLQEEARSGKAAPSAPKWRLPIFASVVATVAVAVFVLMVSRGLSRRGNPGTVVEGRPLEGQQIEALAPGVVSFGGADVRYGAGTRLTLHEGTRTLVLSAGQADVEVTPGLPGRFRVATPRFVVEVLGTRFVVTTESVRTLRGRVRILDRQDRELATLTAGANWTLSQASAAVAPRAVPPSEPTRPERPALGGERAGDTSADEPHPRTISASELLALSRTALARGESRRARSLAQRALAAGPTNAEAATSQLLLADALLIEKRPADAVEAYRRVVRRWPRAAEAEVAQFAVAQLLLEQGAATEAQVALRDYLARYPLGRFVREAREHLSLIRSGP